MVPLLARPASPARGRFAAFGRRVASFLVLLLAWNALAMGFHEHVEAGPTHSCGICTAVQAPATSVVAEEAPAPTLQPSEVVLSTPDRTPRAIAHVFVPNRAPPLG
jgi:hypothetical protein